MSDALNLNRLAIFLKVVEAGSISAAAKALEQPKSNVSRAVSALETQMGVQLLHRNARVFQPTEAGRKLFLEAQEPMMRVRAAAESVRYGEKALTGRLTLTASVDLAQSICAPLILDFAKQYPDLNLELRAEDSLLDLAKENIDLALRFGRLRSSSLKQKHVGTISIIFAASPSYLAQNARVRGWESLREHRVVGFTQLFRQGIRWQRRDGTSVPIDVKPNMFVNNALIACDMVRHGAGVGFLPDFVARPFLRSGELIRLLPDISSEPVSLNFVWPARGEMPAKVRLFVDFSREKLQHHLGAG